MMLRALKRSLYSGVIGMQACLGAGYPIAEPRVYYGGARAGNRGGPQVKVDLLQSSFPEFRNGFNILYLLSGALYMPPWAINRLKDKAVTVVLNQNGVFYPAWFPDKWQEENARMADAMKLADHVFYQSEFCKLCADKFLGVSSPSSEILYNGVDTSYFKPHFSGVPNKRFRFLITGNIASSTYYRLTNALQGLVLARQQGLDVEMLFAGILPEYLLFRLNVEIDNLGMKDYFLLNGPYTRNDAPKLFAGADAYLITKHNDPCPNVVLEAMSSGLPILYSSSGGVPELVGADAGVGMVVPDTFDENPVPSAQQIVDAMSIIMQKREEQSIAARKRAVEMFDISIWINRHRAVFKTLNK